MRLGPSDLFYGALYSKKLGLFTLEGTVSGANTVGKSLGKITHSSKLPQLPTQCQHSTDIPILQAAGTFLYYYITNPLL